MIEQTIQYLTSEWEEFDLINVLLAYFGSQFAGWVSNQYFAAKNTCFLNQISECFFDLSILGNEKTCPKGFNRFELIRMNLKAFESKGVGYE